MNTQEGQHIVVEDHLQIAQMRHGVGEVGIGGLDPPRPAVNRRTERLRHPMRDGFGQECNNCTACVAVCPTDALVFTIKVVDVAPQGPGHLGRRYRHGEASAAPSPAIEAKEAAA